MRLRLRIERNELPAVSVLWTIGDTELKQTVSQFVERVNERFPLEGESWGLEDYAVTVAGYEALHYGEVGSCFQNEDEVLIKPLATVEARARRITGRDQITEDGRHLLDGVPFGKPLLKRPRRPDVHIPPRKRQRLDEIENGEDGDEDEGALVRFEELDDDEDEDEEDDADFSLDGDEDEDEDSDEMDEEEQIALQQRFLREGATTKRVKFADSEAADTSDDSSESSDEDESSDASNTSSDSSDDDASDPEEESTSDSSDGEWNGIPTSDSASPGKQPGLVNGSTTSTSHATTNGHHSETTSEASLHTGQKDRNHRDRPQDASAPRQGQDKTKIRNARRREQRQLKHLKESGMLPAGSTFADMKKLMEEKGLSRGAELKSASEAKKMESLREQLLGEIASGGIDIDANYEPTAPGENADEPPDEEPIATASSIATAVQGRSKNGDQRSGEAADSQHASSPVQGDVDDDEQVPIKPQRRKRLEVAGTNRLIFGSLGVRTPKTQAEKDALQKKLVARAQRVLHPKAQAVPTAAEEVEDPDAWINKLEISAVECCDEDVTLSAPPFPFQQRWDPQYQNNKRKRTTRAQRRKKRRLDGEEYVETYDKYNKDGTGDALNYDDPVEDEDDGEYWEDGALLDDEYEDSEADAVKEADDGFPKLPADISTLPTVTESDAKMGDYIVYTELACTAATNWQPQMVTRTARLDSRDDEGWSVTHARRDLRPKEYNEDGDRVYSKFEMEGASDDEDEEISPTLVWSALQEPRLLQRASEVIESSAEA